MTTGIVDRREAIKAELSRYKFPLYCEYVHNRPLFPHQLAWNEVLDDPTDEDIMIVAPPDTYKSSLYRMRMEWELGQAVMRHEDLYSLYLMNVEAQAAAQLKLIEDTIELNPRYKLVFPWVQPDKEKGWNNQIMHVKGRVGSDKEPNIMATGFLGSYQGWHFHRIYIDDPTNPQDVFSETVMESQRQQAKGMLLDRKRKGGRLRVILTPWGPTDLRRTFKEMKFRIIENPIEGRYPWGPLLFPEKFGDDYLEELRAKKGSALFDLTYMLREEAAEGNLIKREWFKMFTQEPELILKMQIWDIAITEKETGDYSVCGTWGVNSQGYYLLDVMRARMETPELERKISLLAEQARPNFIVMLTSGVGKPIYQSLRARTKLNIEELAEEKQAVIRLREVLPIIEAGRVWLRAGAPWVQNFLDECARYTGHQGGHDDQVAMMSGALRWLKDRAGWQRTGRNLDNKGVGLYGGASQRQYNNVGVGLRSR